MRLAFFLFVLFVPFALSLQPTAKETSQSEVHNREGLSDKTDSFLGTGVGLESEVASGLREKGIWRKFADNVKGVLATASGTAVKAIVQIAPTYFKGKITGGANKVVDIMDNILTYHEKIDADQLIAKVVLQSYYTGLSNGVAEKVLSEYFENWKPGPECPLGELHGKSVASDNKAAAILLGTALSNPDSATLAKATANYNKVLRGLYEREEKIVLNPACNLGFLRGPLALARMMVPYGASYWAKEEFKRELISVVAKASGIVVNSDVVVFFDGLIRPSKRRIGLGRVPDQEIQDALRKLVDSLSSKQKAGGVVIRCLFEHVVKETQENLVDDELKPSLGVLKEFYSATKANIAAIYEKAAKMNMTLAVTTWENRKISDVFGGARADIKDKTPASFAKRMFTDDESAKKTGDIKQGLPPADDSFLAVGGGFDDEAFLGVEGRANAAAPAPEFNWFTDDPRGQYQDCVLDKPSSQGFCAACWSFAATTMLDYRLCGFLKRNKLQPLADPVMINGRAYRPGHTKLSNQICLSCTRSGDCLNGGAPSDCLDWVKNNGLVSHACQPYKSWELFKTAGDKNVANGGKLQCPAVGKCAADGVDNMNGYIVTALQTGYVTGLDNIRAALQSGPVTLIMATPATFITWGGKADGMPDGIFSSDGAPQVGGAHSYHIVTVFGYGQEMVGGKTRKFFLCLNSWGSIYNPLFFRGMLFNIEEKGKGPWFKLDAEDPALELDKYPAYWATPGLKLDGGQVVPVNAKDKNEKPYWGEAKKVVEKPSRLPWGRYSNSRNGHGG